MLREERMPPMMEGFWAARQLPEGGDGDDSIQEKIEGDQHHCDIDGFPEALEEDGSKNGEQQQRDSHLTLHPMGSEGVVRNVGGSVGGR